MEKDESLEDRIQRRLREAAGNILEGTPKILMGMEDVLVGVSQWSDGKLFSARFFVWMNGIDTIVRLIGFPEKCEDSDQAVNAAFSKAREIFENLDDGKSLVTLFALTNDSESIAVLLQTWYLFLRIENESHERMKRRRVGLSFMTFKHFRTSQKSIDDLLNQTRKQINAWLRSSKISPSFKIQNVLMALNPELNKSFLTPDREDFRNDAFLKYEEWFSQHMGEVERQIQLENLEETLELYKQCYSILKNERPLTNPAWDDFAPRALYAMTSLLLPYLPMLSGKTEKIPFKIYNDLKTRLRRLLKEETWVRLDQETETEEGQNRFRTLDLARQRIKSEGELDSFLVNEVLKDLLCQDSFRDDKDRIIAGNYGKSDQEIADVIFEITGKSITKQAVRKRRVHHVEPIIRPLLEIRKIMMEDQERDEERNVWGESDQRFKKDTSDYLESDHKLTDIIK